MKTNPWLLVLDLIEFEAVPAKNNTYTIQCILQQQVSFSHLQNSISDKQSIVCTNQSVVSVSRSKNSFYFRVSNSLKQFSRERQTRINQLSPYLSSQIDCNSYKAVYE